MQMSDQSPSPPPGIHSIRRWVDLRESFLILSEIKSIFLGCPERSLVPILTELPRSHIVFNWERMLLFARYLVYVWNFCYYLVHFCVDVLAIKRLSDHFSAANFTSSVSWVYFPYPVYLFSKQLIRHSHAKPLRHCFQYTLFYGAMESGSFLELQNVKHNY
jgi:hypothetical protein